jgi:hypothetical protein
MRKLASYYPRLKHTLCMLDSFDLKGPNGHHNCLVYEILGPNIQDTIDARIDARFPVWRLPGKLAKVIAKQSLSGLIAYTNKILDMVVGHSVGNTLNHSHVI